MYLQDLPLTAYAFCYGPLIITVLGFIVFAGLTDANARRSYLRRINENRPLRRRSITAETPAGPVITIQPEEEITAPVAAEVIATPLALVQAPPAAEDETDSMPVDTVDADASADDVSADADGTNTDEKP